MESNISYKKITDCRDWSVMHILPEKEVDEIPRPKTPNLKGNCTKMLKLNKIKLTKNYTTIISNEEFNTLRNG